MKEENYIKKEQYSFSNIESLKVNDGIYCIQNSAFYSSNIKMLILPKTLKIIEEKAFYNNKITELTLDENIKYIGSYAFMNNLIEDLNILTNIEEINKSLFMNNKIKKIIIPSSVIYIKEKAFMNNLIENLILSDNLKGIEDSSFSNNKIKKLILKENIEKIGKQAFLNNKIDELIIPNNILTIKEECFKNNEIEKLKLNEKLKTIENEAFKNNKINILKINENLENIENKAFKNNKIKKIIFNQKLRIIKNEAFYNNLIEELIIPCNISYIASGAFNSNKIKKLTLNKTLKEINANTFKNNLIEELIIPDNIEKIESEAFKNNEISNLKLSNNLKIIKKEAFKNNNLKTININDNIKTIEENAFDNNVIITIKNHTLPSFFIEKFGTQNIIKAKEILDIVPNFNFNNINAKILDELLINNDNVKGLSNNVKLYNDLFDNLNIKEIYYSDFYKMCYILGLFNSGLNKQKDILVKIKEIINLYDIKDIHKIFSNIELKEYNEKISTIFLNEYNHPKFIEIASKLYNNYEVIFKAILESKKEQIGILNAKVKKENNIIDKKLLNKLKKEKKIISLDNVIKYLNENVFIVKKENNLLNNVTEILSSYINQDEFDKIERLYEKAKKVEEKYFSNLIDQEQNKINYYWPSRDNPINIVLGYICDCCSKLNAEGEDIMIQSMINPAIKNLIIYDSMKNVIAKSTAFYNIEKNYIIFNNVEIKNGFIKHKDKLNELYEALIRGIKDQVKAMEDNGYKVEDIRIGMSNNDLNEIILKKKLKILHSNLLKNYSYKNYEGDANKSEGQAVIKI